MSYTLFILGAGASEPYGLPLGWELTSKVVEFFYANNESYVDDFTEQSFELNGYSRLAQIIRNSRTPTLDAYIAKNNQYADSIKQAIAGVIQQEENRVVQDAGFPNRDWVAWMYHNMLDTDPDSFSNNSVAFLSFNYERIPHCLMSRFMANTYGIDALEAYRIIDAPVKVISSQNFDCVERFVYAHGVVGSTVEPLGHGEVVPSQVVSAMLQTNEPHKKKGTEYYQQISSSLLFISENPSSKKAVILRNQIQSQIQNASRIVFLGLGYHADNLAKLGLDRESCRAIGERLDFFGGTGVMLKGKRREDVKDWMGPDFVLGDPDQDCLAFLQEYC